MTNNILDKIIKKKEEKILNLKKTIDLNYLDENKNKINNFIDLSKKLRLILKIISFQLLQKLKKVVHRQG